MSTKETSTSSFLRDAFTSYAQFTAEQKQDAQQRALKWLQSHIASDLSDKTILEQFTQQWRAGSSGSANVQESPLCLENLPRSYKGSKSINSHQEAALDFLQEQVPQTMQDEFQARWSVNTKLKVSNGSGTCLKVDERELEILKKEDANGEGKTWYQVNKGEVYYLLSNEEKGDNYEVVMTEDIGAENCNKWFVSKEDVTISSL